MPACYKLKLASYSNSTNLNKLAVMIPFFVVLVSYSEIAP